MALPSSGALSLSMVNTELKKSASAVISMNDADVRALAGVASGAISLSNFYGKSNMTLIGTFSVSMVRVPTSGYYMGTAPNRVYKMEDATLGTMLGYSTWSFDNSIYEPASALSNVFTISLPGRTQPYTGLEPSSIKAIEVGGVLYDAALFIIINMEILGSYSCSWAFDVGEMALAAGANTVKVYR